MEVAAPEKLRLLADWHDANDAASGKCGTEVQDDLRRIAEGIDHLRAKVARLEEENTDLRTKYQRSCQIVVDLYRENLELRGDEQ